MTSHVLYRDNQHSKRPKTLEKKLESRKQVRRLHKNLRSKDREFKLIGKNL